MIGLALISAMNSAAMAFDSPTRQSWVPLLVDREYVGNAVGLNSVAFNAPAVVGPALAGLLIVWVGVAGAFYFNAAATLAVVVAVMMMRPSPPSARHREPTLRAMQQRHRVPRAPSGAAMDHVRAVRHGAARAAVQSARRGARRQRVARRRPRSRVGGLRNRLGGFGGALVTAYFAQRERRSQLWLQSGVAHVARCLRARVRSGLVVALPVLFLAGVGTLASLGVTNTLIQMLSPDEVRGRALAVYTMIAIGDRPVGSLVDGAIASAIGLRATFALAGAACTVLFLAIWLFRPAVRGDMKDEASRDKIATRINDSAASTPCGVRKRFRV